MTSIEMLREFKVGMDKIDSDSYPEIYPEQIFMFINKAIDEIVEAGRRVFEKDAVITDSFKSLIDPRPTILKPTKFDNEYIFSLDELDYLYYIRASVKVAVGNKEGIARIVVEQQDTIEVVLDDPHRKPKPYKVPILFANDSIIAYGAPSFIIKELILTYLRKPKKVSKSVDCDLDENLHHKVVDTAIQLALNSLGLTNKE